MRRYIMAPIALSFSAGILAAQYVSLPLLIAGAAIVVCIALAFGRRCGAAAILAIVLLVGALRYAQTTRIRPQDISHHLRGSSAVEGIVASDPEVGRDRTTFTLRAERVHISTGWRAVDGSVMAAVYSDEGSGQPRLSYGDRIRARARLYQPFDSTNPGRFSWKAYLDRQGIHTCASIRSSDDIETLPGHGGSVIVRAALAARRFVERTIARTYAETESAVVSGMVLGTYAYLDSKTLSDFTRTGTLHLLAASGFNCWVILLLGGAAMRAVRVSPQRRNLIVILLIFWYMLIAGAKPSLVRAAVMASLWLLAVPLRRPADTTNLLFTALFVMLLMDPAYLFEVGFQLSFLAVLALLVAVPPMEAGLARVGLGAIPPDRRPSHVIRWTRWLMRSACQTLVATAAVTLVTGPVVAYYFNYVSLVSMPANLAVAAGAFLTFCAGTLTALIGYIPLVGGAIGAVGGWIVQGMLHIIDSLGTPRWASVSLSSPGPLALLGYYALLYAGLSFLRSSDAKA